MNRRLYFRELMPLALSILVLSGTPAVCNGQNEVTADAAESSAANSAEVLKISASAPLRKSANPAARIFYGETSLGELQAGGQYLLSLSLTNNTEVPIAIKTLKTSCTCISPRFPESILEPGKTVSGDVFFRVPAESSTGEFHGRIEFHVDPASPPIGAVNFSGAILGSLYAGGNVHVLELKENVGEWDIPVFFTAPITLDSLTVEKGPGLEDVQVSLVRNRHGHFLRLMVADPMLDPGGVLGSLELIHKPTGQSRRISLTICRAAPFRLSPQTLHFVRKKDRETEYRAIAMLQLSDDLVRKVENDAVKTDDPPETLLTGVQLRIGDETITLDSVRLGTSLVYKLTATCTEEFLKDQIARLKNSGKAEQADSFPANVVWMVQITDSGFSVQGDFRVTFPGD